MPEQRPVEYVALGRIGAAYGIKGWVKLISFTNPIDNILNYHKFMISLENCSSKDGGVVNDRINDRINDIVSSNTAYKEIEIDHSRPQGKGFVGHIKGCDERNGTRDFTGKDLLIDKSTLPALNNDAYYWHQLEGLRVLTRQGDDLGNVHHLIETGANDVLIIRASESSIDDQERLIPYLRETVIDKIDLEQQVIEVNWEKDY